MQNVSCKESGQEEVKLPG